MMLKTFISMAALLSSAFAIQLTSWPTGGVQAGQSYAITWAGGDSSPVTLLLRKGPSTNLVTVGTITSSGTGESFTWVPETSLPDGNDYAIQIIQGSEENYSGLFPLTGGSAAQVSGSAIPSGSASIPSASASVSASASISRPISSIVPSVSPFSNSTTTRTSTSTTSSRSSTTSTSSSASLTSATSAPNAASGYSSPIALVLGAVAAVFYLQ